MLVCRYNARGGRVYCIVKDGFIFKGDSMGEGTGCNVL